MDLHVPSRLPKRLSKRKLTPTERFLGFPPHAPLTTTGSSNDNSAEELHEDDVVFLNTGYFAELNHHHHNNNNNNHSSATFSSSAANNHHHHHHHHNHHRKSHPYASPDSFGILAVLPENENSGKNIRSVPQLFHNHKASVSSTASSFSSSSSSSSVSSSVRAIPAIPRPAPPQHHHHDRYFSSSSSSSIFNGPMSAPVDVPIPSEPALKALRERYRFEDDNGEFEEEEGEKLPPHEIVARKWARTPVVSCSVLEGAGRTLKGRDLRTVRNAVWRQTGFID